MITPIGFIGLGVMGSPMAGHLARAGHPLTVFDIDAAKSEHLARQHENVTRAKSPKAVAQAADIVITMLPSGEYVREVALGTRGLMAGFSGGELLVDTSSCEPWITVATASALAEKDIAMVDAPTSGAEVGARSATLVFMAGGREEDVTRARVALDCMGKQVFHLGPLGSGHTMKAINNLVTAMNFLATAEGLALGTKLGLDPNVMTDIMNVCTSMSWITQTHIKQRITNRAFDDPFKLELMVKDIGIALGLADDKGIEMPLSSAGQAFWQLASDSAAPEASVSELVRWVEKITDIEIRGAPESAGRH
jgi:3-hydroxyisobutyrate dehydrogenase